MVIGEPYKMAFILERMAIWERRTMHGSTL